MGVVTGISGRIYSTGGDGPNSTTTPMADVEYNDPYPLVHLSILRSPQNQTVSQGSDASFSLAATGTSQLNFQWYFGGTSIPGATSTTLTVTNANFSKVGTYSVVISNASGSVTNSAVLSLLNLKMYAALTLAGPVGASYKIESTSAFGNTNVWQHRTNLTLTSNPQLWFDLESPTNASGFYRAILLP